MRAFLRTCDLFAFGAAWSVVWLTGLRSGDEIFGAGGLLAIVATALILCSARGLYRTGIVSIRAVAYTRLMAAAAGAGVVAAVLEIRTSAHAGWMRPVAGAALSFAIAATARYVFDWNLREARARGAYLRPVTVIGSVDEVRWFADFLSVNQELGYVVAAAVGCQADPGLGIQWHSRLADVRVAATTSGSTAAILLGNGLQMSELSAVARELTGAGIPLQLHSGLTGVSYRRLRPAPIGHEPFLTVEPMSESRVQLAAKRVLDIVGSAGLLLLSAPILCVSAVAIKLHDGGTVFFRQTRIGRGGKPIRVHKLRTMSADAEARLTEVQPFNERLGPLFKTENDPRVTKVGKVLRRTSIDEIPQLFDVLRGDMSLVGPRPALPVEVAAFDDELLARLRVRPGVTGLWQVEARDKPSFDAYRRLDLFYVENWSMFLDLAIIIDTIPSVANHAIRGLANFVRRRSQQATPTALPELAVLTTDSRS